MPLRVVRTFRKISASRVECGDTIRSAVRFLGANRKWGSM